MSETWGDYEARINWLQMYSRSDENEVCRSPLSKRRPGMSSSTGRRRSVEYCECDIQYYEGDQNRTYSSSAKSFQPTGAELWPCSITRPRKRSENCTDDEELSAEAISFLNAQNDYFGPGGEYIADRIENDFDLRWDFKRARKICIAHLDVTQMNILDLHFACSRGRSLISFWRKFETLERPSQAAWDLAGQAGHLSFPEFFLYWRPDFAGPHVQLQTGSLSGGNIPPGVLWPRRWWKEALRRRNALLELKRNCGDNCLRYVDDLLARVQKHIDFIITVRNDEVLHQVVKRKTTRYLPTVLTRIDHFVRSGISPDSLDQDEVVYDNKYHRPMEIENLSRKSSAALEETCIRRLICSYFCLHEYVCSTIGAARLRFRAKDFHRYIIDLQTNLLASQNFYSEGPPQSICGGASN